MLFGFDPILLEMRSRFGNVVDNHIVLALYTGKLLPEVFNNGQVLK